MHGASVGSVPDEPRADLHQAARVAGGDETRARCRDVRKFAIEHQVRRFRFDQVVNAGRAAALIRLVQRNELHAGNSGKYCKRRLGHPLRMLQMTWRIVGHL